MWLEIYLSHKIFEFFLTKNVFKCKMILLETFYIWKYFTKVSQKKNIYIFYKQKRECKMKNNYSLPKWSQTRNSYSLIQAKHLSLSLSLWCERYARWQFFFKIKRMEYFFLYTLVLKVSKAICFYTTLFMRSHVLCRLYSVKSFFVMPFIGDVFFPGFSCKLG